MPHIPQDLPPMRDGTPIADGARDLLVPPANVNADVANQANDGSTTGSTGELVVAVIEFFCSL